MMQLLLCAFLLESAALVTAVMPTRTRDASLSLEQIKTQYFHALKVSLDGQLLRTPSLFPGVGQAEALKKVEFNASLRENGLDWPLYGLTMVGYKRLTNLENLLRETSLNRIKGDFVECGVWRGGSSVFAKAVWDAYNEHSRRIHLVDSFNGLPKATQGNDDNSWNRMTYLKVKEDDIRQSFAELRLLDDRVEFVKGYFRYSLPVLRKEMQSGGRKIAILRMDGDMYESTMDILYNLYDLVSIGGCIIIDDFSIPVCRKAMDEFMRRHAMNPVYTSIDGSGAYFCKSYHVELDHAWYRAFNKSRALE